MAGKKGLVCFHYRHRPQLPIELKLRCAFIAVEALQFDRFHERFHRQFWLTSDGERTLLRCMVQKLDEPTFDGTDLNAFFTEKELSLNSGKIDVRRLPELSPPQDLMPFGNVGTPVEVFLRAIKECRLPPRVIKKLELDFPKSRKRRIYQNVPLDYGLSERVSSGTFGFPSKSTWTDVLPNRRGENRTSRNYKDNMKGREIAGNKVDDVEEEWDRHESLHDDVTEQERSKERLFEKELEVTWDKGSSGLVFYTDAQHWDELEGDFDEKTTDDWDIDPSYVDKDGQDWKIMREEVIGDARELPIRHRHQKIDHFKKPSKKQRKLRGRSKVYSSRSNFGRKILSKFGWREGLGLGKAGSGITEPIECCSQTPGDVSGLGYRGERLKATESSLTQKES